MSYDIQIIKDELTSDPLSRSYGAMTDGEVAVDMNTFYRDAEGGLLGMLSFLAKNRHRTNEGTDTALTSTLGRLIDFSNAIAGDDVFGTTRIATMAQIHAAKMFVYILDNDKISSFDFVDTEVENLINILKDNAGNAAVWSAADATTLKRLSQSKQSRAMELQIKPVKEGHVTEARA